MKIVITDDHDIIREGLKKVLSGHEGITVAGEASSIAELEKLLESIDVDFVLLDISLPDKSGMDFVADIKKRYPDIKVLLFSIYPEEKFAKRVINMGADGYLSKSAKPHEIIEAINKINNGGKYLRTEVIEELFLRPSRLGGDISHDLLSNREFEVLRLIAKGNKLTEIAESLNLSINTIASYKSRILEKLKLKTTAELIRYAIDNNLIEKF